jgi:hypothetical protein
MLDSKAAEGRRTQNNMTLNDLRRFTVARNFFKPTTLKRALNRMGFVQADPIRAPARAQDLILRHRVNNYRAGDLERRYEELGVEEDFFVNYGYVTRALQSLMHPRSDSRVPADDVGNPWPSNKENAHNCCSSLLRTAGLYIHVRSISISRMAGLRITGADLECNHTSPGCDALPRMLRIARREKGIRVYAAKRSSHSRWTNRSDERVSMQWLMSSFVFTRHCLVPAFHII